MIGLALEGGGVRGSYQAGAYMAFKKCGIKFDQVAGTSIGSFNAAMICAHKEKQLMDFWYNIDTPKIFGLSQSFAKELNKRKLSTKLFSLSVNEIKKIFKNKGIELDELRRELNEILSEDEIRNSKMDFGLVTVKRNKLKPKPIYKFKDEMEEGKINEYITASCFLPVFKSEKLIDGNYYLDGGYYDVCPTEVLYERGCDKVYAVRLMGTGIFRKSKHDETVYIVPSRDLGSILELDLEVTRRNIELGFYDTYRVLKNLDGYRFTFNNFNPKFYDRLIRKVDPKDITKVKKILKAKDNKELIIKAFEYILDKEKEDYFAIYNPLGTLRIIKRKYRANKDLVYKFVCQLRFF